MLLAALPAALLLLSTGPEGDDWPCWRGARGDGLSHGTPWASTGKTLWTAEIDLGYSAPCVSQGRVVTYGFDAARSVDVLRCLDVETGAERWRAEWPGELRANQHEGGTLSTPAVADGRVYAVSSSGLASCFDLADGARRWQVDLVARHELDPGYYGFAGSPVLADGRLLVAVGRALALDPETGATVWASEPLNALYSTPVALEIGGAPRLALFSQDALHLLDPATGAPLAAFPWHESERLVNAATPVVAGERLFVSSAYDHGCALVEFGPEGPRALFRNRAMRNKMAGCVLIDRHLFGFDESVLKCLDLEGNERWRVRGFGSGALSGGDGKLAVLTSSGELVIARDGAESFEELSRVPLFEEGVCWTPPVIAGGRLYLRNNRGRLVCRDHRGTDEPAAALVSSEEPSRKTPSEAPPEGAALLARHVAAIGGAEVLAAHPARRLTGTYEQRAVGFVPAPFEILQQAPDKRRAWIQLPPPLDTMFAQEGEPGHLERIHDGAESFELNRYRGDKLLGPGEAREESVAARLPFASAPETLYRELRTEARERFDERDCWRVRASTLDGKARTLHFEADTGLLAGREAEDEALVVYRDYKAFDGLRIATSQRVFRPEGGIEEHFRVESVAFEPIDAARFARGERVTELVRERESAGSGASQK